MKRPELLFSTLVIFGASLFVAYQQSYLYQGSADLGTAILSGPIQEPMASSGFFAVLGSIFFNVFNVFANLAGGNVILAIIALALVVELITLFPAISIQLKQKKIHLFHKKLVDRFNSGELGMSKEKRELDIIYSVNERIHRRGALLFAFQTVIFLVVLVGFYLISTGQLQLLAVSSGSVALLAKPVSIALPILAALSYLLHALIKMAIKQREDYISNSQIGVALAFAITASVVTFFFAANFAALLSVYFMTHVTFATIRYVVVEANAKAWGRLAQKELLKMLRSAKTHKNKAQHATRKFHHLAFVRHFNYHLLEEGISMSLVLMLLLTPVL